MTASRSHFKPFEPAEARASRGQTMHVKPGFELSARRPLGSHSLPDLRSVASDRQSCRDEASAVTVRSRRSNMSKHSLESVQRPGSVQPLSPDRSFYGSSHYQDHQEQAREARHEFFPYRDEYAPRSKRLLYEMALAKHFAKDEDKSEVSRVKSESCFTVASSRRGGQSAVGRSNDAGNTAGCLQPIAEVPPPTADSMRIPGGVARRRKELEMRSPAMCEADRAWLTEKWEEDGPAGLTSANFIPAMHKPTMRRYAEHINNVQGMMNGRNDTEPRARPGK